MKTKRATKAKLSFKWFDIWVGVFVDREHSAVYICPLPMIVFKVWREDEAVCDMCSSKMIKIAFDTGEGWGLEWNCTNEYCNNYEGGEHDLIIEWPFGNRWMSGSDLRQHGFEIV